MQFCPLKHTQASGDKGKVSIGKNAGLVGDTRVSDSGNG